MTRVFLTFIAFFFWTNVFCQVGNNMVGYPRYLVKEKLERYNARNNYKNTAIQETDTSMRLPVRDSNFLATDFYYHFDGSRNCDEEKILTRCNDCLTGYLEGILSDPEYNWNKINDRLYLSKFSKRMTIEIVDDRTSCPYIKIVKVDWSRKEYKKYLQP